MSWHNNLDSRINPLSIMTFEIERRGSLSLSCHGLGTNITLQNKKKLRIMLFAITSPELHKSGSFVPLLPVQRMFSILNEK